MVQLGSADLEFYAACFLLVTAREVLSFDRGERKTSVSQAHACYSGVQRLI